MPTNHSSCGTMTSASRANRPDPVGARVRPLTVRHDPQGDPHDEEREGGAQQPPSPARGRTRHTAPGNPAAGAGRATPGRGQWATPPTRKNSGMTCRTQVSGWSAGDEGEGVGDLAVGGEHHHQPVPENDHEQRPCAERIDPAVPIGRRRSGRSRSPESAGRAAARGPMRCHDSIELRRRAERVSSRAQPAFVGVEVDQ